jgi:proline dehydrogenase
MLRALLLYLSHAGWSRKIVMSWGVARRVALRFVAGERQVDAIEAVRQLNSRGMTVTLDVLGESITEARQAREMAAAYLNLIETIGSGGLQAWVSLKLTALGLDISADLCRENMRGILSCAQDHGLKVTIDMEDRHYTQRTLDMFHALQRDDGFNNVGTVIQSYLYRSDDDIRALAAEGADIRLCKGAYKEPASVAYPKKADVDAAYVRQMKVLLDAAKEGRGYPAIATHDEKIITQAKAYADQNGIPRDRYEFQMLYGVRTALQEQLIAEGYRMRVYVPFGEQWYPYVMRRLAERPANLWFFASNFFRK